MPPDRELLEDDGLRVEVPRPDRVALGAQRLRGERAGGVRDDLEPLVRVLRHPPVRDESVRLSRAERLWGYAGLVLFVLTFIPVPMSHVTPEDLGLAPAAVQPQPDDSRPPAEEFRL